MEEGHWEKTIQHGKCHYCGTLTYKTFLMDGKKRVKRLTPKKDNDYTRDHIVPKKYGGKETVPCCFKCNQLKGSKLYDDFKETIKWKST